VGIYEEAEMKKYAEDDKGIIHLISPINGEFTLCGNAFDGDNLIGDYAWKETRNAMINCLDCIKTINVCKMIKLKNFCNG
jgi:hypothetical protein